MAAYLSALALCATSLVLGAAICCRPGRWSWTAPAVGLSATMLLTLAAIRLPGHVTTAVCLLAAALILSGLSLRRRRVDWRAALAGLPAGALVLAFTSLPFVANGRIGELGASALDDLAFHMGHADALQTVGPAANITAPGYPLGPHTTVAVVGEALGMDASAVFTGLLLAVPVLTALTALAAFQGVPLRLGTLGASLTGVAYLVSSYFAQGAFKEPILALCFLGFALTLRDARRAGIGLRHCAGLLLTAAGGVAAFGVAALAWPVAALAWLGVLETARRRRLTVRLRRTRLVPALAGAILIAGAGLALAAKSGEFFRSGPGEYLTDRGVGGNFVGQISPFEAFGIWPGADFRFVPSDSSLLEPGVVVAVGVALFGAWWCRRRREWELLSAALAGLSIYLVARPITLAYFSGKALAVVAPILALIGLRALAAAERRVGRSALGRRTAWAAVAALFVLMAGYSSSLALRGAHVRPQGRGPDVAAFRSMTRGESTLYLGRDNFVGWELRGTRLSGFQGHNSPQAWHLEERPLKSSGATPAVDVDSLDAKALDFFRYLVAPRTAYASLPPANLKTVRRSRWHVLWERRGPTPERRILAEGEAPGAVLDCRRRSMRRLARRPGVAYVRPRPVVGRKGAWREPDGGRPGEPGATVSGGSLVQTLRLRPGTWQISLSYFSDGPLRLRAGTAARSLPAYVGDPSSFFAAARVRTGGERLTVEVEAASRRRLGVLRTVLLGSLAAVPVDARGRLVSLRQACGAYVDWYRLGLAGASRRR